MKKIIRIPFTQYWLGISNAHYPSKTILSKNYLWIYVKVFDSSVEGGYYWKAIY